jgi:hypothetical protein
MGAQARSESWGTGRILSLLRRRNPLRATAKRGKKKKKKEKEHPRA